MNNGKVINVFKTGFALISIEMAALGVLAILVVVGKIDFISNNQIGLGVGIIIVLLIMSLIAVLMSYSAILKKLGAPLKQLQTSAYEISEGNVNVELKDYYNDEIGEITNDFKVMIKYVQKQTEIARQIANKNLNLEVLPKSERDELGQALKLLVETNNQMLFNIRESGTQLLAGAGQVASASQALAQGSTEQASAIEEITASMKDIARKTNDNAGQATEADNLSHEVKKEVIDSNERMHKMIDAMNEISSSSHKISKVIKAIDDIAFQTNILALNATVEAARAGVHGKGFAVVAEEVKALAEKSAAAAADTAELIQNSIDRVEEGNTMASDTAQSLEQIVGRLEQVVSIIDQIAVSSNDQATSIAQINIAMTQVSQVVQTNSATSEQCASASEELSNQARNLRALIGDYKLKENNRRSMNQ